MSGSLSLRGDISPVKFAILAPLVLFSQHLLAAIAFELSGTSLLTDTSFWLLPLRRLTLLPSLPAWAAALTFAYSLLVAWCLAILCFRRASRSRLGFALTALAVIPGFQLLAVALLAVMPIGGKLFPSTAEPDSVRLDQTTEPARDIAHILQGLLAGVSIIVAAVVVSALTFGAYGWGLFVATPFFVGLTTAYIANRKNPLPRGETLHLVIGAGCLGTLALLMFALEGLMCILIIAPLAAVVALFGGWLGRTAALHRHGKERPIMSLALLPALFALEAASPPATPIDAIQTIEIDAPPSVVWTVLTSSQPIRVDPGLVGRSGLAFPVAGRLHGNAVGAERIGQFSTGLAQERVTAWTPGRVLAFQVLSQPPAMEEMSPWRRVYAPHVTGYFDTSEMRYDLTAAGGSKTRLTLSAKHILRIDPVLYWAPIAKWAVHQNIQRVLLDVQTKAETARHRRNT